MNKEEIEKDNEEKILLKISRNNNEIIVHLGALNQLETFDLYIKLELFKKRLLDMIEENENASEIKVSKKEIKNENWSNIDRL